MIAAASETITIYEQIAESSMSVDKRFALWKVLLGPDVRTATPQQLKDRIQTLREDAGIWCVLLSRGGHFAGAIFECTKKISKSLDITVDPSTLYKILVHKTFHRYVVRWQPSIIQFLLSSRSYIRLDQYKQATSNVMPLYQYFNLQRSSDLKANQMWLVKNDVSNLDAGLLLNSNCSQSCMLENAIMPKADGMILSHSSIGFSIVAFKTRSSSRNVWQVQIGSCNIRDLARLSFLTNYYVGLTNYSKVAKGTGPSTGNHKTSRRSNNTVAQLLETTE